MSNKPNQEKPPSLGETATTPQPEGSAPQADPHQAALNAARDAERAVANSALSAGLGRKN